MSGAYIPVDLAERVRRAARDRCGYCHAPQCYVMGVLQFEHIHPRALGGLTEESNLWLACSFCNSYKHDQTTALDPETGTECPLFNPRTQVWREHFRWSEDGLRVIGVTPIGRATAAALRLGNNLNAITVRSHWIRVGWHPPPDE